MYILIKLIKTLKAIIDEELIPQADSNGDYLLFTVPSNPERLENAMKEADLVIKKSTQPQMMKLDGIPNFQGFDALEVHPCMVVTEDGDVEPITDEKDMDKIAYWSIYGHLEGKGGGIDCLSDFEHWYEAQAAAMYWSYMSNLRVHSPMRELGFNTPLCVDIVVDIKGGTLRCVYQQKGNNKIGIGVDLLDHDCIGQLSHENGGTESEELTNLEELRDDVEKMKIIW